MLEKTGNRLLKRRLCDDEGERVGREIIARSRDMCQCGCQCDECIGLDLAATHNANDCGIAGTAEEPLRHSDHANTVACKCQGCASCTADMMSLPTDPGGRLGDIHPPATHDQQACVCFGEGCLECQHISRADATAVNDRCNKNGESLISLVISRLDSLEVVDDMTDDSLGTAKSYSLPPGNYCTLENQRPQIRLAEEETDGGKKMDADSSDNDEDTTHHHLNVEDIRMSPRGAECSAGAATARSHVAVFCTFGIMFLIVGIMSSFGVFYVELLEYFDDSRSSTSLIGSINCGACHAAAPLVGLIEARIGIRKTVVVGGLLSAIGLIGSSFVFSMPYLYFTYGIISGTGFAIAFTASIGVLASHFDSQRRLDIAVGISTSGMGFGVLAFPPFIRFVIDAYGWRGAVLVCGGLALNVCVFAALSGPPIEKNELIRTLSVGSVAYLRTDKDVLRSDIVSMSMTSVYIMKDTDLHKGALTAGDTETHRSAPYKTKDVKTNSNTNGTAYKPMDSSRKIALKRLPCLSVIGNRVFLILLLSEILSNMTMSTVLTTLPDFAHCNGHSLFRASLLLSIYGTTATLGRLYLSLFSAAIRKFKSHKRVTIAATSFITMIAVLCMGFTGEKYYLIGIWVGLFGIATGAKGTFVSCFVIKLVGARNTITAMGLVGLSCGIGQFGGPPVAGVLFSMTGWYPAVYCFGAVTSLLAVLCVVVIIIMHIQDRRCRQRLRDNDPTQFDN
ncbi:monocarboxylate transporter 12-like [Lineus longissimus]|uniref:monocarboxylate transporter 12-like n=1 Tax=Lineus longissimus TaxID=88925 RepID=UPI002B4F70D0